nr:unnamed protein product [Spirometra erinaceieuropaei]
MDASNNIHPTRRVSDRKSKPSMEALVDHHKRIYWGGPSTPVGSASRHHEQPQHPPLRIRLHLSRVEVPTVVLGSHISPSFPSSGPTPETRISPGPLPKQTLPSDFPSSGLQNGTHEGSVEVGPYFLTPLAAGGQQKSCRGFHCAGESHTDFPVIASVQSEMVEENAGEDFPRDLWKRDATSAITQLPLLSPLVDMSNHRILEILRNSSWVSHLPE